MDYIYQGVVSFSWGLEEPLFKELSISYYLKIKQQSLIFKEKLKNKLSLSKLFFSCV